MTEWHKDDLVQLAADAMSDVHDMDTTINTFAKAVVRRLQVVEMVRVVELAAEEGATATLRSRARTVLNRLEGL
jgi:hypothetical protein